MKEFIYKKNGIAINLQEVADNVTEYTGIDCNLKHENGFYTFVFNKSGKDFSLFTTNSKAEIYAYMCGILNYISANTIINKTYDIVFNDDTSSNNKGFACTLDYCKNYIDMYNGTNESYFADYKGGTVSIVCNETSEEVYQTKVL